MFVVIGQMGLLWFRFHDGERHDSKENEKITLIRSYFYSNIRKMRSVHDFGKNVALDKLLLFFLIIVSRRTVYFTYICQSTDTFLINILALL